MSAEIESFHNEELKYNKEHEIEERNNNDYAIFPALHKQNTLLKNMRDDDPLPLPYANDCWHTFKYNVESFCVIHPRIYALYLLFLTTWPRLLVVLDMYTDSVVAFELYKGNERIWFMLSCLFITAPFILVWSASLRFIQLYVSKLFFEKNNKSSLQWLVNICLMIYIFPPIGSICIALAELFWVIADLFYGIKAFVLGTGLINTAKTEIQAIKSYRRAVEVFAESVPQTLLQLYIVIRLQQSEDSSYQGVTVDSLYQSFIVTLINLCYNVYKFKSEAQLHGMAWSEYALSVLQLAEIPIIKLVPRLPAIKKGYIEEVNFGGFKFDNESLTPLVSAINSLKCRLKKMKISIGSLGKLDNASCKLLGNLLHNTGIQVLISRTSSLLGLFKLFESIDVDHNGYLVENEFLSAIKTLNCSIQNAPRNQQQRIFKSLAIRRLEKRDRVYFYDFFKTTASVTDNSSNQIQFDLTQIDYPLHFIFQRIKQLIETNQTEQNNVIKYFDKLYSFCDGLCRLEEIDLTTNNHVFYPIIDVMCLNNIEKYPIYATFVVKLFDKLLNRKDIFDSEFFLQRNNLFKNKEIEENINIDENANKLIENLKNAGFSGCNIFEYCLIFCQPTCKLFTRLFNVWLDRLHDDQIVCDEISNQNGALYILLNYTNGFHVKDSFGYTPLYYAALHGQLYAISVFSKYMFGNLIQNQEDWHVILHALLKTSAQDPTTDIFESFISSDKIDVNFVYKGKHLADYILIYRCIAHAAKNKNYLLKCLTILEKYGYDFINTVDADQNNVLHMAAFLNDPQAAELIIESIRLKSKNQLTTLLNSKNKHSKTPLTNAILNNCTEIVKTLILIHEQEVDYNIFTKKFKLPIYETEIVNKWIICLFELMVETNGSILNKIDKNIKANIYMALDIIYTRITKKGRKHNKNHENALLIQNVNHIRQQLKMDITSNVNILDEIDEIYHSDGDALESSNIKEQYEIDQYHEYRKWYLKTINASAENSCIGLKNISLKNAANIWCCFDCLSSLSQTFLWLVVTGPMDINLCYIFFAVCAIIWMLNVVSMYGVSNGMKILIIVKFLLFPVSSGFCVVLLYSVIIDRNNEGLSNILYVFIILNALITLFAIIDVYKIYKWIEYYENGGLYKGEMKYIYEEEIMEHFYKIVNKNDIYNELNGKYCKVMLVLDEEQMWYRVKLIPDVWSVGARIVHKSHLKLASDQEVFINKLKLYNDNENYSENHLADIVVKSNIEVNGNRNDNYYENNLSEYERAIFESKKSFQMEQNKRQEMYEIQKAIQLSIMEQQNTQLNTMTYVHDFALDDDSFIFGHHQYVLV